MFKNKKDYVTKRKELLNQAQSKLESGDVDGSNSIQKEIQDLDNAYEAYSLAHANMQALQGQQPKIPESMMDNMEQQNIIQHEGEAQVIDHKSPQYETIWKKEIYGVNLTANEREIINQVNAPFRNAAVGETTDAHTLVIPETIKNGIWERAAELHPVLTDLLPTCVKGDVTIIKDTSSETDADWVDEEDESKDAVFTESELNLMGCELCKSVTVSWKLKKMAMDEYIPYVIRKLGNKVGNAIAKALFSGKGRPGTDDSFRAQAKGIITAAAGGGQVVEYDGTITYKNLTTAMGKILSAYKAGASIYANNKTVWDQLANILDTNQRPIFVPDVTTGGVGRIFGLPVKEEDGVPEGAVVIGNYADGYAFNFNEAMTIYTEEHVKARKTDYMAYGIADGDILDEKAFAVIQPKMGI